MLSYFTRHPIAANLMLIAVLYLGISALPGMERESFPEFAASQVTVTVAYPGASPVDVDENICVPLEDALSAITNLDEISCLSVNSAAIATLTMTEGADIGQFFNDISSEVSAIADLPEDSEEPAVAIAGQTELIALVSISGIDGENALVRYADQLADALAKLPGVATTDVSGISDSEYFIRLNDLALRRYGVSPRDVANAVEARSYQTPLGEVQTDDLDITMRFSDARRSVQDLESLIVLQNDSGALVRLSDVAEIALVPSDSDAIAEINGDRAAIISINKTKTEDAIDAFERVEAYITAEEARFPDPFKITVINNTTENVAEQIDLVLRNSVQSLLLVVAIMWLFFGLREAIWISLALPFSFAGGLFVMSLLGVTINMISLLALLMAIGLIMDDSIVISENISKWRKRVGPVEAAIKGTQEVMSGVISSFLTTAGVFGPLMFLQGEIGAILQVIPIVLLITLFISLVEAFLILPNHLSHEGKGDAAEERFVARVLDDFKERRILPVVALFVRWRYLTVGSVFAVLIVCIGLIAGGVVKVVGFPETEGDTIAARIALNSGTKIERTQAVVEQLVAGLDKLDAELTPNTVGEQPIIERYLVQYGSNSDVNDNGAHTVTVTVDLLGVDDRNIRADDVALLWRDLTGPIADLVQSNFTQTTQGPGGSDLDVELSSRNLEELEAATFELRSRLLERPDVVAAYQDFRGGTPEIRMSLNEYGYTLGLTPQTLADQMRAAFTGTETDSFREGLSSLTVRVELGNVVANMSELETFPVTLSDGNQVALGRVADLVETNTYSSVTRKDGLALSRIIGDIDRSATTSTAISTVALEVLGPEVLANYPSVSLGIGGATEEQQETQTSIATALLTGLFVVYAVLAFQFRSYTLPFFIMISIPFALIGVVLGHMALGMDLSMPSFIGFASLAGVVVNNAILFMNFFETHIEDDDYLSAAVEAVRQRFRPVLLSSSTTFIGLLPVVFETSPSIQTIVPVVVSVAFGLLASFVLVVFVFPAVIAIYFDYASVRKWQQSGETARNASAAA